MFMYTAKKLKSIRLMYDNPAYASNDKLKSQYMKMLDMLISIEEYSEVLSKDIDVQNLLLIFIETGIDLSNRMQSFSNEYENDIPGYIIKKFDATIKDMEEQYNYLMDVYNQKY